MIKIFIAFALFAGIVYYYDIDVMALVDKSGAPQWLEEHGYRAKHEVASSTPRNPL
jgi:hypothetical protein